MENGVCMCLFVITTLLLNALLGDGRQFGGSKDILKTIKTADGEVIDCVDIYKQPAFAHPLLLNHTIQLKPSFDTTRVGSQGFIVQSWQNHDQCPQGSIPILRKQETYPLFQRKLAPFSVQDDPEFQHQLAQVQFENKGGIHGAHAKVNIWRPFVNPEDESLSQLRISAGAGNALKTIEVGWRVAPATGSSDPKTYIYWSDTNNKNKGCYNLDCPGFVQTSQTLAIGAKLDKISAYGGKQFDVDYDIRMDDNTKNWWVTINGNPQGYWPSNLFSNTFQNGDIIRWGGETIVKGDAHYKTSTEMGNGHFADEGFKKASYMTDIKYVNNKGAQFDLTADDLDPLEAGNMRYSVYIDARDQIFVYHGGPGGQT